MRAIKTAKTSFGYLRLWSDGSITVERIKSNKAEIITTLKVLHPDYTKFRNIIDGKVDPTRLIATDVKQRI